MQTWTIDGKVMSSMEAIDYLGIDFDPNVDCPNEVVDQYMNDNRWKDYR